MGRKWVIQPHVLLENQSLAANFESEAVNIQYLDNVAIAIVTSGVTDNTGLFVIKVSVDNVTWETLTLTPPISALADADDQFFINMNQVPFPWFKVDFTAAGITPDGTCSVTISAKQI